MKDKERVETGDSRSDNLSCTLGDEDTRSSTMAAEEDHSVSQRSSLKKTGTVHACPNSLYVNTQGSGSQSCDSDDDANLVKEVKKEKPHWRAPLNNPSGPNEKRPTRPLSLIYSAKNY